MSLSNEEHQIASNTFHHQASKRWKGFTVQAIAYDNQVRSSIYSLPTPPKVNISGGIGWSFGFGCCCGPFFGIGLGYSLFHGVTFGAGAGIGTVCGIGFGSGLLSGVGNSVILAGFNTFFSFSPRSKPLEDFLLELKRKLVLRVSTRNQRKH
ncbi:hypothetical protein GpartN1_g226.t1 [Galdieria partita]|uniref:Uncharacterized protein n=1 Tax=Galdieria partita TaxID=83374 RepID=A0A9C7PQ72_9RHOD|nr:hypothetical protein GpartN1_g226.t1 [Galdieria partita]